MKRSIVNCTSPPAAPATSAGKMSLADFMDAEAGMSRSPGHCMTMGTASTMASMAEALGIALPHNAAIPAVDSRRNVLAQQAAAKTDQSPAAAGKKKAVILFWLSGGPSQLDMWDPKPTAPVHIRGQFGDIATSVPGTRFGALLPNVAAHADKLAIIRSMNVGTQSHDTGIFRTLLASRLGTQRNKPYPVSPDDHPAIGALLHRLLGPSGGLPPWVVVPRHFTTGTRFYKGQRAGFLGPRFEPLSLGTEKTGSLERSEFTLKNLELRGEQMTVER
ncbi:DUF1501 domain-containing protein, partial [uncultured Sulfitobacter sp.]|uniref:DUF1501 domain-containing protein n=1 Tax=uncultured Sulfitobacter sp. TaxID=191468 RepID=UPI00259A685B